MRRSITLLALLIAFFLGSTLSACDREGPMERAGESVDKAAEKAGDSIERTDDRLKR